jgi:hypothetical protein
MIHDRQPPIVRVGFQLPDLLIQLNNLLSQTVSFSHENTGVRSRSNNWLRKSSRCKKYDTCQGQNDISHLILPFVVFSLVARLNPCYPEAEARVQAALRGARALSAPGEHDSEAG